MKNVLAYTVQEDFGIICSDGSKQTEPSYLDFLMQTTNEGCVKVFSDLNYDVSQLLALLQLEKKELDTLANTNRLYLAPYSLTYIPGKWFSVDKGFGFGHPFAGFSDASQYNDKCRGDAIYAYAVAKEALQAFNELGLDPKNIISPVNVYRKERLEKLALPTFDDIPERAMELAYGCVKGNWLEAFAIGHWDKVYDYDINSAYPYQASLLFDFQGGTWKQRNILQKDATYGYCKCEVSIDKDFSPIIKTIKDKNYTPKGVFTTYLTKNEIEFIDKWELGFVTIIDGWWYTKPDNAKQPLRAEIMRLYQEKNQAEGMKREIVKRIMSGGFYGLFIELKGNDFGEHFFAPYAAEIEANTRLQIAETCLQNNIIPLHIAVDGIITDVPINLQQDEIADKSIGYWRLEHEGKCLICSSGLVCLETKNGKGDFSIKYDDIINRIQLDPKKDSYKLTREEALTLAQAQNLGRIQDVGKIETVSRTINFGDSKREYEKQPRNFGELAKNQYQSTAWDIRIIEALEEIEELI